MTLRPPHQRPTRTGTVAYVLASFALLAACSGYHNAVLGPGGSPVESVKRGSGVDLRFAQPRRLGPRTSASSHGLPPDAVRVVGTVVRAHADTLFVRIERAAPLGHRLHDVIPAVTAPVVIDRDVAARLRS